jgi:Lrp/AsnC family transcriptional regulator for asnA, asnC and gidA
MVKMDVDLDSLDLKILEEIRSNGRLPASHFARELGISETYACKRLQRLLDRKITRITAFANPLALGYRVVALTGIQVSPAKLRSVSDRLRAIPNVKLVTIAAGWQDIIIWSMFANASNLSTFLARELGSIPGIQSAETMMVIEWRVCLSPPHSDNWRILSFSDALSSHLEPWRDRQEPKAPLAQQRDEDSGLSIDQLDLRILGEIEKDGRQPVSHLAKKLGISWANASARLQRLLDKQITRVVAFASPLHLGYRTFGMIGIKVSPGDIDTVMDQVQTLPNVWSVVRVTGRYDVIVETMFPGPIGLSDFLAEELGPIAGIQSMETMVALDYRKMSFGDLAYSHLQGAEQRT